MNMQYLTSFLDEDFYKFAMGQLVFHDFPTVIATYEFINRGKTVFPPGFDKALNHQLELMATLSLTYEESEYLKGIPGIRPTYVEWLQGYRFDPSEVVVNQTDGELFVHIQGPWYRTIFWEVRLMAVISELYFRMTEQKKSSDWVDRLGKKTVNLIDNNCVWADFGTRRRFSHHVQDVVVDHMSGSAGFLGTSNVDMARWNGVKPIGTSAHEMIMGLSALYGPRMANRMYMQHWLTHFQGLNGIVLTDTFTTEVFLRDFNSLYARAFDGVRQDSGDPYKWAELMLSHYNKLGIDPKSKTFVFSDGLDDTKLVELTHRFSPTVKVVGGIGTYLSNDVGPKALNMVIKMTSADFGTGPVDVVKISDTPGKHTGKENAIKQVKNELRII